MAKNPVEYAEQILDVHGPYNEAVNRLSSHDAAATRAVNIRSALREHKAAIDDRKNDLIAEAETLVPNTGTKADRQEWVKAYIKADQELSDLEVTVRSLQSDLDAAESNAHHHELGLRVLSARMNELGGLLQFYGAAKVAAQRNNHTS